EERSFFMPDLTTTYLGLRLKNPIIVSSSNLTATVEKVVECENSGAGAVVLKSLFEEQIIADTEEMIKDVDYTVHPDAFDFFRGMGQNYHTDNYIKLIEDAKARVSIPVIASLNCVTAGKWIKYAENLEKAGADALELNVFILPADVRKSSMEIENIYIDIARKIKRSVKIPVAMKIGFHFSGMAQMLKNLSDEGIDGLVLFNRFYRPDVDIEKLRLRAAKIYSTPQEIALPLQWIALLSGEIFSDFAATTGIHDADGVIKQLLVGAKAVQLCSTFYLNGIGFIKAILTGVENWMERHNFKKIDEFCGKLCQEQSENPEQYERSQYIKALVGIS
ncbi:MAG: dihydroorotate dehydrogenase-like protein, partial [Spirochaetota bacterium]